MSAGLDKITTTANTSLVVKVFFDNGGSNVTIGTVATGTENDRFTSRKKIDLQTSEARGLNDFYIQFEWSGGSIYRSEKHNVTGAFNIDRIRFNLGDIIDASFVGAIQLPVLVDISPETD